FQTIHGGTCRSSKARRDAIAPPIQLRAPIEQFGRHRECACRLYRTATDSGNHQQTFHAVSTDNATRNSCRGSPILHRQQSNDRDAHVDQGGEELMRKSILLLPLLLWSMSVASAAKLDTLLQPGTSPLVTFRILFTTGSAFDPPGKEGLAALTASM